MSYAKPTPQTFSVEDAWKPLPTGFWRIDTAQHLLRRMGFSATPKAVKSALRKSPKHSIEQAFQPDALMPKSEALAEFESTIHTRYREIYGGDYDSDQKRTMSNKLRREDEELFREYAMDWFVYARDPKHSAQEKFVLFLQDIFVVERPTVKECYALYNLQQTLREGTTIDYPELCKRVSRDPAMVRYLDLNKNTTRKPNENFARELFELFILGEGNYTEADIKEASRAFTGYRIKDRTDFFFQGNLHDEGVKTVFNEKGNWNGDEVIDITFRQPAAKTFLIRELIKFYLTEDTVPETYIEALGELWADNNFNLGYLLKTFFQSRLFFHPTYRGNLVKSPIHFYLGLCHDLNLDVVPFDSRLLRSMRIMGQDFYNPPNVRGWLYGEYWINSTTISGRRQVVDYLFSKIKEKNLNGNEKRDLKRAREEERGDFLVTDERLNQVLDTAVDDLAEHFTSYFITEHSRQTYLKPMQQLMSATDSKTSIHHIRNAIIALLQSPAYNLS
jgi:hypothetical protein